MHIDSQGGVSVGELIVYIPALVLSIIVCSRHGFSRASGWFYTLLLCLVRIVGAICQLLTYSDKSSGLIKATLIIDSIGISPLLLATLGMISRLVDWVNAQCPPTFTVKHFRIIQLLVTLGLILSIAGGTGGSTSSDGTVKSASTSKVAIILFIVGFVAMVLILVVSCGYLGSVPKQERRIAVAVGLACPFIAVRLLYSVLAVFLTSKTFSIVGGSVGVRVGMAVIEEFIVVIDYLILGYTLEKLEQNGDLAGRAWKSKQSRQSGGNRSHSRRASSSRQRAQNQGNSPAYNSPAYNNNTGYGQVPFNPAYPAEQA